MRSVATRWVPACLLAVSTAAGLQAQAKPQTPPSSTPPAQAGTTQSSSASEAAQPGKGALSTPNDDPFASTYTAPASKPFAIRNATILTATGPAIQNGTIVVSDGKIVAVGASVRDPRGR